jgi:hypothetical protein
VSILGFLAKPKTDELEPFRKIDSWAHAAVADGASVDEVVAEALKRIRSVPLPAGQPVATMGPPCTPEESVEIRRRSVEISSGRVKAIDLDDLMADSLRRALSERR